MFRSKEKEIQRYCHNLIVRSSYGYLKGCIVHEKFKATYNPVRNCNLLGIMHVWSRGHC